MLTVWDAQADVTYWQCVQNRSEKKGHSKHFTALLSKNVKIHLPTDNTLDDVGVRRIRAKTKHRFSRFEDEEHLKTRARRLWHEHKRKMHTSAHLKTRARRL